MNGTFHNEFGGEYFECFPEDMFGDGTHAAWIWLSVRFIADEFIAESHAANGEAVVAFLNRMQELNVIERDLN
jgi:hypothetical protein